eukprot:gene6467-8256_t
MSTVRGLLGLREEAPAAWQRAAEAAAAAARTKAAQTNRPLILEMAQEALPSILSSRSLTHKVADEVKRHHRWVGVVFYYSEQFPRALRVLSLATTMIIMLFMQSLTYDLTNGGDAACLVHTTEADCLSRRSPYQTGASMCAWVADPTAAGTAAGGGTCELIQPDNRMEIVLFVAIFSALVSTPIAFLVEGGIGRVPAAPTALPSKLHRLQATALRSCHLLLIAPNAGGDGAEHGRGGRRLVQSAQPVGLGQSRAHTVTDSGLEGATGFGQVRRPSPGVRVGGARLDIAGLRQLLQHAARALLRQTRQLGERPDAEAWSSLQEEGRTIMAAPQLLPITVEAAVRRRPARRLSEQKQLQRLVQRVVAGQGQASEQAKRLDEGQQSRFLEDTKVNVDEEMSNLIELQSAYAANARVISTVKELLDVLMRLWPSKAHLRRREFARPRRRGARRYQWYRLHPAPGGSNELPTSGPHQVMTITATGTGAYRLAKPNQFVASRSQLDDLQRQLVTKKRSETFADLGMDRGTSLDLNNKLSTLEGYLTGIQRADVNLKLMTKSLSAELDRPLGAARAQVHGTYIVAQTRDGMVIVDQHAAHERLVYERLKAERAKAGIARQPMLLPEVVELDPVDADRLNAAAADLASLGLVIESFGPGAVLVREAPAAVAGGDLQGIVRDVADALAEHGDAGSLERRLDHVLATMACHNSVRAGRRL